MAKNKKGGSRHKKAKNYVVQTEKIVMCDESADEHYAYVSRAYGNGQFGVFLVCSNNENVLTISKTEYRGRVSGRMRKQKFRNFVRANDLVLIAKRDFQTNDEKVDIIHVYKHDVVKKLAKMGLVPIIENVHDSNSDTATNTFIFSNEDEDTQTTHIPTEQLNSANTTDTIDNITTTATSSKDWEIDISEI